MSYRRSYRETLSGAVRVSVDYPASEHGGSTSEVAYWEEDVEIDIEVDTDAFDESVAGTKASVEVLTGAVVATGAANAVSKHKAGEKVSKTILAGFFKTISFELEQQLIELRAFIGPKLQEIQALHHRCDGVKAQMEQDYRRISGRYARIFGELDAELKRRVMELDKSCFGLMGSANAGGEPGGPAGLAMVPAVTAGELGGAETALLMAALKRDALGMIMAEQDFISLERGSVRGMEAALSPGALEGRVTLCLPALLLACDSIEGAGRERALYRPGEAVLAGPERWKAVEDDAGPWGDPPEMQLIEEGFNRRLSEAGGGGANGLDPRVLRQVQQLWKTWRAA